MRIKLGSVRTRLTLWYAGTLAIILLVFGISVYFFVRANLHALVDTQLDGDVALLTQTLTAPSKQIAEIESRGLLNFFHVLEDNRLIHVSSAWTHAGLDQAITQKHFGKSWLWLSPTDRCFQLKHAAWVVGDRNYDVIVGRDTDQIHDSLHRLAWVLLIGSPMALLFSLLGGYMLATRALLPIQDMADKARFINAENMSHRLTIRNPDDEIGSLATVLNDTFTRLDDAFERLRRFTQDAAHELRTPLAVIRSVGEVGLQHQRGTDEYREVIVSILEEADRLARLVDGLLTLTRADSGRFNVDRKPEDIAALCWEVTDCLRVLAEDKQQTLTFRADALLSAIVDRDTLRLALFNIVANAIQFTPERGEIHIRLLSNVSGRPAIEINDNGPGIAKVHQEQVFERFYRIDPSRSHETGGAGLGLAIARWAVESNGGWIEIDSTIGLGTRFRINLAMD